MKVRSVMLALLALMIVAAPVSAGGKERVGNPILVWGYPQSYPAGQPFHIAHGWGFLLPDDVPLGRYMFLLDMDGTYLAWDFVDRRASGGGSNPMWKWVYNFPAGKTGTHTFTGHWLAPCRLAVEGYGYPGPCPTPFEPVEVLTMSSEVTFTP